MPTRLDTVVIPLAGKDTGAPTPPMLDRTLLTHALQEAGRAGAARAVVVGTAAATCPPSRPGGLEVVSIPAPRATGLGAALLAARAVAGPGPVGVLLPDEMILGGDCMASMQDAYIRSGSGHMVGIAPVSDEDLSRYGIVDPLSTIGMDRLVRTVGIVERPGPNAAPSNLAVVGRYILHSRIFDDLTALAARDPSHVCLTEAISAGIGRVGLLAYRIAGRRFDCSRPEGLSAAMTAVAVESGEARGIAVPAE